MTFRENAAVLETYLHNIRNIEEVPPGPMELEALDAAIEVMKAAVENVEYGAFAWDKQRGMFVQIGRPVPVADEYRKRAMLLPANGLQDIGKRRELRKELQARCDLTELQAVNIINGFHIPDYVKIAAIKAEKEAQENEN